MTEILPTFLINYSESDFTNPHEVVRSATPKIGKATSLTWEQSSGVLKVRDIRQPL